MGCTPNKTGIFGLGYSREEFGDLAVGDLILLSLIIETTVIVIFFIICCVYMLVRCRSRSRKYRIKRSENNGEQELNENDLINQENSSDMLRETDLAGSTDKLNIDNRVYSNNNIASGPPPAPPPPQLTGTGITEDDAMYDQVVTVKAGKTKPVPTSAPIIPLAPSPLVEYQNTNATKPANKTTVPAPPPPPPENSAMVYAMVDKSKKKSNNPAAKPSTPVRMKPPGENTPTPIIYDDVVKSDTYNVLQHNRFEKSPTKKAVKGGNTQQLDDPSFYDTIINQDYTKATPPFSDLPNNYDVVNL